MAGNQVGGVFDDQPVKPACGGRFSFRQDLGRGVAATGEHAVVLRVGNECPDQDLRFELSFDTFDGPLLIQTGAHQHPMIDWQKTHYISQWLLGQQGQQRRIELQRSALCIEQQARLWIVAQ
ncbi:hypothetical protein D3C80_1546550 [compost metagenome]